MPNRIGKSYHDINEHMHNLYPAYIHTRVSQAARLTSIKTPKKLPSNADTHFSLDREAIGLWVLVVVVQDCDFSLVIC